MGRFTQEIKPTKESIIKVVLTVIKYEGREMIHMTLKKGSVSFVCDCGDELSVDLSIKAGNTFKC
jgi:hypothetical protein